MAMSREELKARICAAVKEYIADEEAYDDNAQLCIKPETLDVYVEDSRNVDTDSPEIDCYDVMDFVEVSPNPEEAGRWIVDETAVEAAVDEYL
ncbi:MAG: hypothetical protein K2H96_02550 [Muribaculaceae bacterium]|nr:hypothetical protein [Muribaculaceae bacterium]